MTAMAPPIPGHRLETLHRIAKTLQEAERVVMTTHVNADGDGAGSEAALAAWLTQQRASATIVNPSPFPDTYAYLLGSRVKVHDGGSSEAVEAMARADAFVVLDTASPKRLNRVHGHMGGGRPVIIMDHHVRSDPEIEGWGLQDPSACATGELIYDLLHVWAPKQTWPREAIEGIYAAIVTDTGGFRYSNTDPRTHHIAADLLARGVDPGRAYRRLYGDVPVKRLHLLRVALDNLCLDEDLPLTWVTIPHGAMERLETTGEDLDGILEQARSVRGTEVALLFRPVHGGTKVSWRSTGDANVQAIAARFGGGGHEKASGALVGMPLEEATAEVLDATRAVVREIIEDRDGS